MNALPSAAAPARRKKYDHFILPVLFVGRRHLDALPGPIGEGAPRGFDLGSKRSILMPMLRAPFDVDTLMSPLDRETFFSSYWVIGTE
jgi:hypothetical protein